MGPVATLPLPLGSPQKLKAGDKIRSAPQVGLMATSPLSLTRYPTLQSRRVGGGKWHRSGPHGYINPAVLGVPKASDQRTKSQVDDKWAY